MATLAEKHRIEFENILASQRFEGLIPSQDFLDELKAVENETITLDDLLREVIARHTHPCLSI
jgi:hypothetical protein